MKPFAPAFIGATTVAALLSLPLVGHAGPITLTIDSTQSSLTLSGVAFGLPYTAQASGALVDSLSGTLVGTLSGGVITFSGGSTIAAAANPAGPFSTGPNPVGSEAGNFGVSANGFVTGYGVAAVTGTYQGLVFDLTAGTVQDGVAPSGQTFTATAGTLDYGIVLNGTISQYGDSGLTGTSGANTASSMASFNGSVLTLPVEFNTVGSNREEEYIGTIVADVVAVPEPSTLALAAAGLLGFAFWRLRRC